MNAVNDLKISLSGENGQNVIHGMWFGTSLSRLELLTIHSFLQHGHEFNLWVYDEVTTPLPAGVILRDAESVLPRSKIYRKNVVDPETGVGAGSYSGVSSDLFRYKVLYDHGGIWVDMDVTCLRPFDFKEPYVFRAHRIGCVGSILKAPKGSRLMARAYEQTAEIANENTPWLEPLRILSHLVAEEGLKHYIRSDIANPDMWSEYIRPLIEDYRYPPEEWYAIHWLNEFFRTLSNDGGRHKGQTIIEYVPDKDEPKKGSFLHELYRFYKLSNPYEAFPEKRPISQSRVTVLEAPKRVVNILIASLTRGGAERIVIELSNALADSGVQTTIYVLTDVQLDYAVTATPNLIIKMLRGNTLAKLRSIAFDLGSTGSDLIHTHLIAADDLSILWSFGIRTIPVIHNARPGWLDPATAYNRNEVPMVVAVADFLVNQLRESGLQKPITTIRHEITRRPTIKALVDNRNAIRKRFGIRGGVFLIGMVGQFKLQKAYPRAIRVLAELRKHMNAKLMIIGSWDHNYGSGRKAFEDTMKLAVELGVVADVITPGNLEQVELCYPAFDAFLSTSIYEGLSISLLEAINYGCKIVAADAGGNKEALPETAFLIKDGNDIDSYVSACQDISKQSRREVPAEFLYPQAVLQLWEFLLPDIGDVRRNAVLFLTKNLNIGGPQRALINLLTNADATRKWMVGVTEGVHPDHVQALQEAQITVLSPNKTSTVAEQCATVLQWVKRYQLGTICFWNFSAELKLYLTKVLATTPMRLVDVSPGPMLFDELNESKLFQKRIAFTKEQYFDRLDHFVGLYDGGLPDDAIVPPEKKSIIPRGVAVPPLFIPLPPPDLILPETFNPHFAIGTCCRIVPDKRLSFLLDMMTILEELLPEVSLTIVGGADGGSVDYCQDIEAKIEGRHNIRMVGTQYTVQPFLAQFQVFVMVSDRQGCPNASLEAMAMHIPVVANNSGGTAEQVIDAVTGFLAETPDEMAKFVCRLLTDAPLRRRMGQAAYDHVLTSFSLDGMVAEFDHLLSTPHNSNSSLGIGSC